MNKTEVLKQDEFIFRILINDKNKFYGLEGIFDLIDKLPTTVNVFAIKESSPICKIYCKTNNHSDYMGIESRLKVKTELL